MENYYAVFYYDQYYIGRALEFVDNKIKLKFLTNISGNYYWPRRDDVDIVEQQFVLRKVKLNGNCPFQLSEDQHNEIRKLHKSFKLNE